MRMVISADLHLREDRPRCRIDDDWVETQKKALNQLVDICINNKCNLFLVGDIFHRHSEFRMVIYIQEIAKKLKSFNLSIYYLCGNHDSLYHSSSNIHKSAIGLLKNSENCFLIKDYSDEFSAPNFDEERNSMPYMFIHTLTIPEYDKPDFVNCETPESLLKKFPDAKWIFTGDYHKNFVYEKNGRYVINPGCLIRQVSDMKDYQCGVYVIDTDLNKIDFVPIVDDYDLVDDSHILRQNEKDERIENMVDKLMDIDAVSLDFIQNIENVLLKNDIPDEIRKCVKELIYEV